MMRPLPLRHESPTYMRLRVFVPSIEAVGVLSSFSLPEARQVWVEYVRGEGLGKEKREAFAWEDLELIPARCGHYWVDERGRAAFYREDDPPGNPSYCLLCGMSHWRHVFTECP